MEKSKEFLQQLPTPRLLAYFKAERKRRIKLYNTIICDYCWEIIGDKEFVSQAEAEIK